MGCRFRISLCFNANALFWYKGFHGVAVVAMLCDLLVWHDVYNGQAVMMGEIPAYITTEAISQFVWLGVLGNFGPCNCVEILIEK